MVADEVSGASIREPPHRGPYKTGCVYSFCILFWVCCWVLWWKILSIYVATDIWGFRKGPWITADGLKHCTWLVFVALRHLGLLSGLSQEFRTMWRKRWRSRGDREEAYRAGSLDKAIKEVVAVWLISKIPKDRLLFGHMFELSLLPQIEPNCRLRELN